MNSKIIFAAAFYAWIIPGASAQLTSSALPQINQGVQTPYILTQPPQAPTVQDSPSLAPATSSMSPTPQTPITAPLPGNFTPGINLPLGGSNFIASPGGKPANK